MRLFLLPVLALLAACGASGSGGDVVVRDSAGIRIVENPAPGGRVAFELEPEPVLSIGSLDGAPEYTFQGVRDAALLPDGRIVVADGAELRFYDEGGRHLRTAGGEGEGPGEFSFLNAVVPCGGEIVAGDMRQQRLSVFDIEGTFLRTEALPSSGHRIFSQSLEACDDAGRPILRAPMPVGPAEAGDESTTPVLRVDLAGDRVDTVARLPTRPSTGGMSSPFAPSARFAFGGSMAHALDTERMEVRSHGPDGALLRIARVPHTPRPVTDADNRRAIEDRLGAMPPEFAEMARRQMEQAAVPAHMPAVRTLAVDAAGRLWIQPFSPPWEEDAGWLVLDADGALLGTVELPPRFRPLRIAEDRILGVAQDELDVSYVRVYRYGRSGIGDQ